MKASKKKRISKDQSAKKKLKQESIPLASPENKTDDENYFQFGGLPDRNLKKNLGCG